MGNGDMKVTLGGPPEEQKFYLAKNDLWRLKSMYDQSSPVGLGCLTIQIPALRDASYCLEQTWAEPTTNATFVRGETKVHIRSMVAATQNLLLIEMEAEGTTVDCKAVLQVANGRGSISQTQKQGDVYVGQRAFEKDVDIPSGAAVAWKLLGDEPVKSSDDIAPENAAVGTAFTLSPGKPVTLVMSMDSRFKSEDYVASALKALSKIVDKSDLAKVRKNHADWWSEYWSKSYVEIGDPKIEQQYYRSLYAIGALSRDPVFPPGIFGIVTNDKPAWFGDYHLNYNHLAPFYGLCLANRIEQCDPEVAPILDFRERGKWYAKHLLKCRGVLYPVGIGPLGIETTIDSPKYQEGRNKELGGLFHMQRSNAAYCLVNISQRWRTTLDPEYGRKVYPLVLDVVNFWEDYLQFKEGRYVIVGDAIHEGSGHDVNPIQTLGLLRNSFDLAIAMSKALDVDADRREKWQHILQHLSPWLTQQRDGKEVFRYTEQGMAWNSDNTLGIQHIYPAGAIGLDSDPHWIQVSHNTIEVMNRWLDSNGSNSFFPAAVRVGYNPEVILSQLRRYVDHTYPNGFQLNNPHGIENLSTVPNTINEMLCMSHVPAGTAPGEYLLRVFPVWPKDHDAKFVNLRAGGAFLVSSELKDGEVTYVSIKSEKGKDCQIVSPWPDQKVQLFRNGQPEEILSGARFLFKTQPDKMVVLRLYVDSAEK